MKHLKKSSLSLEQQLDGMVTLHIQKCTPEQILTMLSTENIPLFQITMEKQKFYFSIYLDDFKAVQRILRSHHIRFHICRKRGLPFLLSRMKRRKGLWVGIMSSVVLWQVLCSFLWDYEVYGNTTYSDEHIIALVQAYGLWPGSRQSVFDYEALEHEMELDHPEFTWIQLEPKGTTLCISVKERLSDTVDTQISGSIVAKADGVITEFLVYTGTALAAEGAQVSAGQVLIGGWDYPERVRNNMGEFVDAGEPYAVSAKGVVRGQTVHRAIGTCALEETRLVCTGKSVSCTEYLWKQHSLFSVGASHTPYQYSDDETTIKSLFQWGRWQCPIKKRTTVYREQIAIHHSFTPDEAYQTAIERARYQLQMKLPQDSEFIRESCGMHRTAEDGTVQAEVVWIVDEPIGMYRQVLLPANNEITQNS